SDVAGGFGRVGVLDPRRDLESIAGRHLREQAERELSADHGGDGQQFAAPVAALGELFVQHCSNGRGNGEVVAGDQPVETAVTERTSNQLAREQRVPCGYTVEDFAHLRQWR